MGILDRLAKDSANFKAKREAWRSGARSKLLQEKMEEDRRNKAGLFNDISSLCIGDDFRDAGVGGSFRTAAKGESFRVGARVEYFTPLQPLSVGDPYEDGPTRNRRLKKAAEAKYRASVVQRRAEKLKKQGKEVTEADTEAPELPPFKASGPTHRDSGIIFLSNIDKDTGDDEILRLAKEMKEKAKRTKKMVEAEKENELPPYKPASGFKSSIFDTCFDKSKMFLSAEDATRKKRKGKRTSSGKPARSDELPAFKPAGGTKSSVFDCTFDKSRGVFLRPPPRPKSASAVRPRRKGTEEDATAAWKPTSGYKSNIVDATFMTWQHRPRSAGAIVGHSNAAKVGRARRKKLMEEAESRRIFRPTKHLKTRPVKSIVSRVQKTSFLLGKSSRSSSLSGSGKLFKS